MFTIGLLLPPSPSQGHHQPNIILIFQAGAHGTDISTGNQPGIPSLPAGGATPDAGSTASPSQAGVCPAPEGSYCPDNTGLFPSYPGLGLAGGHDRNHNTALPSQLASKAGDATESNYCSTEVYQGYNEQHHHHHHQQDRQTQQPAPAAVK